MTTVVKDLCLSIYMDMKKAVKLVKQKIINLNKKNRDQSCDPQKINVNKQ